MVAQITPLSDPPSTDDPENFDARGDEFLDELPVFATEANALATEVNGLAIQVSDDRAATAQSAVDAAASANSALNAPGTNGTSPTSLLIGLGAKVFTTQSGKAWSKGQGVTAASNANPANQMSGIITDYTGTILTVSVSAVGGSGTFSDWIISMSAGAALPMSSQPQAEGGTDQTSVMNPLRTKQAIDKFATLLADAAYTTAAALALTATSKFAQSVAMPRRGLPVVLPNATTLVSGPRFTIANSGNYSLPIKDFSGAIKAFAPAGRVVTCILFDNSTSAGVWSFENASVVGETAGHTGASIATSINSASCVALDSTRDFILMGTASGMRGMVLDKATGLLGAAANLSAVVSSTEMKALLIGTDKVLVAYQTAGTTTVSLMVVTISGTTVSPNTAQTFATSYVSSATILSSLSALGSSYVLVLAGYDGGTSVITWGVGITVSGNAITLGSPSALFTLTGNSLGNGNDRMATYVVGSSLVHFSSAQTSTTVAVNALTITGTTLSVGTAQTAACGTSSYIRTELLSTGRFLLMYSLTSAVNGRLVSVSGNAVTLAAAVASAANWDGISLGTMACQPVSTNKVATLSSNGANTLCALFTDTAGALTVNTTTYSLFGFSGALTVRLKVVGTDVYFARGLNTASGVFRFDCSGSTAALSEVQLFQHQAGTYAGLGSISNANVDYGPKSTPTPTSSIPAGRIKSSQGLIALSPPSAGTATILYAPSMRIGLADLIYQATTMQGVSEAEVYSFLGDGVGFSLIKYEMAV